MADDKIIALRERLRTPGITEAQKASIKTRIKFLNSQVKKQEKQVKRELRGENVLKDARQAGKTAEKALDLSPLSRLDATRSEEIENLINQQNALSDPNSEAFAGRRSGQLQDFVSRYQGSTQGYDSSELEALRESRRREMDRGFQSGRAALARGQNNARTSSTAKSAQLAELASQFGIQNADAENDLFMASANEQQRRLEGFGNTIGNIEQNEFDRSDKALANYRSVLEGARADELGRQQVNLGQEAAERAAKVSGTMGILGIQEARRNAEQQNQLVREGYKSNEAIAGKANSGQSSSNAYADELDAIRKEIEAQREGK
jgi:hypothetical protein